MRVVGGIFLVFAVDENIAQQKTITGSAFFGEFELGVGACFPGFLVPFLYFGEEQRAFSDISTKESRTIVTVVMFRENEDGDTFDLLQQYSKKYTG